MTTDLLTKGAHAGAFEQYTLVYRIQFSKIRRGWFFHILIPAMISFGAIWLASRLFAAGSLPTSSAERYVTGAAFVAAMFSSLNSLAHDIAYSKANGEIEYLATFPLSRSAVLLGMLTLPLLFALPSVIVVLLVGRWLLNVSPTPGLEFIVVLGLAQTLLANLGVVIGLYLPMRLATTVATSVPLVIMMFSPVLVPPSAFPDWMAGVGRVLPTTLAVDVIQASLFGQLDVGDWLRLLAIGAIATALAGLVIRLPGWRET